MRLLVKFNWVISCFSFIIPFSITVLSYGVLKESKPELINASSIQPSQTLAIEKKQSQTGSLNSENANASNNADNTEEKEAWIIEIESSGSLKSYSPENTMDDNLKTWWTPNPKRDGVGATITFHFERPGEVMAIEMLNGSHDPNFPKYGDLFKLNNRVKTAKLQFSDGKTQIVEFEDIDEMQRISITPHRSSSVKMTILSVYPGSKWKDLCISEVKFRINPKSIDPNYN